MNLFSSIKCILCLVRCSKYLYFIKKLLCIAVLILAGFIVVSLTAGKSKLPSRIWGML